MRVLVVTNMYPSPEAPSHGTFVREHVESLRQQGVEVDVFFVNGRKSVFNYLWGMPRFWNWLLTHRRYDIIHSQYLHVNIIARMQFMCPVVVTNHSGDVYNKWQQRLTRLIRPLFDRIIAVSEDTKKVGHLNRAVVIPCGIDFELFQPAPQQEARRSLGLPEDKKLVLWAGEYFRPEKRLDIVKKSMKILKKRLPEVELVILSGKPLDSVPAYMNACDALLLVSDKEGSPMVVKEAMACNLPVVSVPAGDVAEIIGGTDGCYICSQDPEDAAQKLELALRAGKRTNGRENIGDMEIGNITRRIMALYEEVIHDKKGKGQPVSVYTDKKQNAIGER